MNETTVLIILNIAILLLVFIAITQLRNGTKHTYLILEIIAKKIGVPEPFEDDRLKTLISERKKMEAIKRYREMTGAELKVANDYIEKLIKREL